MRKFYTAFLAVLLFGGLAQAAEKKPHPVIADGVISMNGVVLSVEDGAYPLSSITMKFDDGDPVSLTANVEEVDLGGNPLSSVKGKKVAVTYTSRVEPDLMDMLFNNHSLMGEYAPEKFDPAWKKITGTLSGAAKASGGDLPDKVGVTAANGEKRVFEYFIDDAMATANGKIVTAHYAMRRNNNLTKIKALKK